MAESGACQLGITVMPEYVQSEGIEAVLDRLVKRAGATAVAISPYVMAPADAATGAREPPGDADAGLVRLLDRPLWGQQALYVRASPSFTPERALYDGLRYQPGAPDGLSREEGPVVGAFIAAAKRRGLRVHLQVQAAIPPGYRVQFGGPEEDDLPRLPDGSLPGRRVDANGSLASPHVVAYGCALIRDLVRAYPEIDALRVDWPEYPPYGLAAMFTDFSHHAAAAAAELGLDFARMRADAGALWQLLQGGLDDRQLEPWLRRDGGRGALLRALARHPGLALWLDFKATLVTRLIAAYRTALDQASGGRIALVPQGFPPPWSVLSGFDPARVREHCAAIGVKLYTMHWPMMLGGYGEALKAANPALDEGLLTSCLARIFDVQDGPGARHLDAFHYPAPDERHPVGAAAQGRKIREVRAEAGDLPVYAFAHAYGPTADFESRAQVAWGASDRRMWVNRYGYLSDAKLDVLGKLPRG